MAKVPKAIILLSGHFFMKPFLFVRILNIIMMALLLVLLNMKLKFEFTNEEDEVCLCLLNLNIFTKTLDRHRRIFAHFHLNNGP